jgi:hypothetical protein
MAYVVKNIETDLFAGRGSGPGSWVDSAEDALSFDTEKAAEFAAEAATCFLEQDCIVEVV